MKKMKLFAGLAATVIMTATSALGVSAASNHHYRGDVNRDDYVNTIDLFQMQNHLLNILPLKAESAPYADMNDDNKINVFDYILLRRQIMVDASPEEIPALTTAVTTAITTTTTTTVTEVSVTETSTETTTPEVTSTSVATEAITTTAATTTTSEATTTTTTPAKTTAVTTTKKIDTVPASGIAGKESDRLIIQGNALGNGINYQEDEYASQLGEGSVIPVINGDGEYTIKVCVDKEYTVNFSALEIRAMNGTGKMPITSANYPDLNMEFVEATIDGTPVDATNTHIDDYDWDSTCTGLNIYNLFGYNANIKEYFTVKVKITGLGGSTEQTTPAVTTNTTTTTTTVATTVSENNTTTGITSVTSNVTTKTDTDAEIVIAGTDVDRAVFDVTYNGVTHKDSPAFEENQGKFDNLIIPEIKGNGTYTAKLSFKNTTDVYWLGLKILSSNGMNLTSKNITVTKVITDGSESDISSINVTDLGTYVTLTSATGYRFKTVEVTFSITDAK